VFVIQPKYKLKTSYAIRAGIATIKLLNLLEAAHWSPQRPVSATTWGFFDEWVDVLSRGLTGEQYLHVDLVNCCPIGAR
jgi:hypothetical protein